MQDGTAISDQNTRTAVQHAAAPGARDDAGGRRALAMDEHIHEWKPCQGWYARYRCPGCGAFGYKGLMLHSEFRTVQITPYLCSAHVNGKPCGGWAVTRESKKHGPWKCSAHRKDKDP
jgi:hypothetical protein